MTTNTYDGTAGNDTLTGQGETTFVALITNTLNGLGGNDTLTGGTGGFRSLVANTLNGGDGDDLLIAGGGYVAASANHPATNYFNGGAGIDTANLAALGAVNVILNGANTTQINGSANNTLVNIENVITGDGDDTITVMAGTGNHTLDGGAGADKVILLATNNNHMVLTDNGLLTGNQIAVINTTTITPSSGSVNLSIPDNNTTGVTSSLDVTETGTVTDVNVTFDINHTWDGDLEVHLIHGATDVIIANRVGSSGNNFTATVLDDEASTALSASSPPFTGSFKPSNALSLFDNSNVSGQWQLKVVDKSGADVGILNSWSLNLSFTTSYTLNNIEQITLDGDAGNNILDASAFTKGGVTFIGGGGNDTLTGGSGFDTVVYSDLTNATLTINGNTVNKGNGYVDTLSGIEALKGGEGDDVFSGDVFAYPLDGGAGIDAVQLSGNSTDYNWSLNAQSEFVVQAGSNTSQFTHIEKLIFADGTTALAGLMPEFQISNNVTGDHYLPRAAMLDDGGFLVAWILRMYTYSLGLCFDPYSEQYFESYIGQYFDATGKKIAGGFTISSSDYNAMPDSQIVALYGGDFIKLSPFHGQHVDANDSSLVTTLTGTAGSNIINGSTGRDVFVGLAGDDSLNGGAGFDTADYSSATSNVVFNGLTKIVTGGADVGTDSLLNIEKIIGGTGNNTADYSSSTEGVDVDLAVGIAQSISFDGINEIGFAPVLVNFNNVIGGSGADILLGDAQANLLVGNAGNDDLSGGDGNDTLNGGAGIDLMQGGKGNDTYYVDNAGDIVKEFLSQGTDSVISTVTYTLSNVYVENLTLTGITGLEAINGKGNASANVITGNNGNNSLDGGAGNDTLVGNEGNDILIGGLGIDNMNGGIGNDYYYVDNAGDVVTEAVSGGTDTVNSSITYALGVEVENLVLSGTATINGTGNNLNNSITGNALNNVLTGLDGNDYLTGGLGNDVLNGGNGVDTVSYAYLTNAINSVTVVLDADGNSTATVIGGETDTLIGIENLTGGAGNDTLTGNSGANVLNGGLGNDNMTGGDGNDYLTGGLGNDVLDGGNGVDTVSYAYLTNAADSVTVALNAAGNSTATVTNGETDTLIGIENLTGGAGNDTLTGNAGNNVLSGGLGVDNMTGGAGNDVYYVDNASDIVIEDAGIVGGIDTIISTLASYTLAANVENLWFNLTGDAFNNTLTGWIGNDTLNGGLGVDTMIGGAGNDYYYVDNVGDVVTEAVSGGIDTVNSSLDYSLVGTELENLTLSGTVAINATGNDYANSITGNALNNVLIGMGGNDVLNGGLGNDSLDGGNGIDTAYYAYLSATHNVTVALDEIGGGIATVTSGVIVTETDTLTSIENLTGGAGNDTLTGNSGANVLNGYLGADTMTGGAGNDYYYVDNASDIVIEDAGTVGGIDTIISTLASYTLAANVENLWFNLTGDALDNTLTGWIGNDTLNGGLGADTMNGGAGNDYYYVDNVNDVVTEAVSGGIDTVNSSLDYSLVGTELENLTLSGTVAINATGNDYANSITGNALNNVLIGMGGNDVLNGGLGADSMDGGLGNDYYYVDNAGDVVTEAVSGGTDTVNSSLDYSLVGTELENLTLSGTVAINGTGNSFNNSITGNIRNNVLTGLDGNDYLTGGLGNDVLNGGNGVDTVNYAYLTNAINSVTVVLDADGNSTATVIGGETDTLTSIENLTGGAGNDTLTGNSGANVLNGYLGADTMTGGAGNDYYYVDNAGDVVTEAVSEGTDTVNSSLDYSLVGTELENLVLSGTIAINVTGNDYANSITGNALDNVLIGMGGNDVLNGGLGADTMTGGAGNDYYYVDNASDIVIEDAGIAGGIDTIISTLASYTLAANVENLWFNLTGDALDNTLTGWIGNDTLNGGLGADTMNGGVGNDYYYVDNVDDVVTEAAGGGTDTVNSSLNYSLVSTELENLVLSGTVAINATGNDYANSITGNALDNVLIGMGGNDYLNGGLGNDSLDGGNGVDTAYYAYLSATHNVTVALDEIGGGIATVTSGVIVTETDTLTSIENLTGGAGNDTLTGNSGANVLNGYLGADTMTGGAGNDYYYVDNAADAVTEAVSEGTDTVNSSLNYSLVGTELENLVLSGTVAINATGNDYANSITGNALNNVLIGMGGNDVLNGGLGADTMTGGAGNDYYYVDNAGDVVIEVAGGGTDTVNSSLDYSLLNTELENLTLSGTAAINATGNVLNNVLTGNANANIFNGGAGADTLIGGLGQDNYTLTESIAATDTVRIATGDSLVGSYDKATGFTLGTGIVNTAGVDKLDLASTLIAANGTAVDGVNSGTIFSHSINNGIISFDDINNYTTPLTVTAATNLADVFGYLQANITGSNTVAFVAEDNTYVFQDGGATDTLVELLGVTASSLNTTGLGVGSVWIA